MADINSISPVYKSTKSIFATLKQDDRDLLYQFPLAVLYLQEAARLSSIEASGEPVSAWTLTLKREHVKLLERQFRRYVRNIRWQRFLSKVCCRCRNLKVMAPFGIISKTGK